MRYKNMLINENVLQDENKMKNILTSAIVAELCDLVKNQICEQYENDCSLCPLNTKILTNDGKKVNEICAIIYLQSLQSGEIIK